MKCKKSNSLIFNLVSLSIYLLNNYIHVRHNKINKYNNSVMLVFLSLYFIDISIVSENLGKNRTTKS